jgi:hypothetical protein
MSMNKRTFVALALVLQLAACGGGGDGEAANTPVQRTEFSQTSQSALAGDWPFTRWYYLVSDQQDWQAKWSDRLQKIDCNLPFNVEACRSTQAPSVDFSRYMVVGLYLNRQFQFSGRPNHIQVFQNAGGMFIEFSSVPQEASPQVSLLPPDSEFFLVPKTDGPITVGPAGS